VDQWATAALGATHTPGCPDDPTEASVPPGPHSLVSLQCRPQHSTHVQRSLAMHTPPTFHAQHPLLKSEFGGKHSSSLPKSQDGNACRLFPKPMPGLTTLASSHLSCLSLDKMVLQLGTQPYGRALCPACMRTWVHPLHHTHTHTHTHREKKQVLIAPIQVL
jgi:hypothetical protein